MKNNILNNPYKILIIQSIVILSLIIWLLTATLLYHNLLKKLAFTVTDQQQTLHECIGAKKGAIIQQQFQQMQATQL
jgi:hypothetical protein